MKAYKQQITTPFYIQSNGKTRQKEIEVDEAKTQALLAKQANNALKYELDRANVEMKLAEHNRETARIDLRNVEGSNF